MDDAKEYLAKTEMSNFRENQQSLAPGIIWALYFKFQFHFFKTFLGLSPGDVKKFLAEWKDSKTGIKRKTEMISELKGKVSKISLSSWLKTDSLFFHEQVDV